MTRTAPLLLLLATLTACSSQPASTCPGNPVVDLAFIGTLATSSALPVGLDPSPAVSDCSDPVFTTSITFPPGLAFTGTLAAIGSGPDAALCRKSGATLGGTESGTRWTVSSESAGAVLPMCGATCTAWSRVTVAGDVTPTAAAPTGFTGALVEVLFDPSGCGSCALPCAGRYTLAGVKEGP